MRKIHRLDLDFAKDIRAQRKITFKEQDSVTLYISIYNDSVPVMLDGQTPRLFIKKSDGTILYQTEVLSIQNNVVAFDVHRQATTCPGLCYAEVEFIEPKEDNKEELITTRSFVYIVEPKVGSIKDAIASVDEAYFLKVVEDFIKQAKIDIAEFRDAVASLENRVIEADDKLEKLNEDLKQADLDLKEAKENALEEISDLRYEAIDDIQEVRDEGIDTITLLNNETVQIIDQIKNNSINLIIDEKDNSIKEMTGFKDDCLNAIKLLKNGTINMVYQAKNDSINEINDTADRHLTTIRNNAMQGKTDIINLTKSSKEEITGLTNESKETIETLRDEVLENIDNYTIEHIEELESIIESLIPTVSEGKELETSLIRLKESLTILKDALQKLNTDGLLLNDKLEVAISSARTTQNELLTVKNEAVSVKVALNQVIEATESLKNALITENERAEVNIAELNVLHPEADARIVELRDLIQQAIDIAIPALKAYIAEHTPAEDLTQVNAQLEELYNAVRELDIRFNNYYTKEETDNRIDEKIEDIDLSVYYTKEEVDKKINNYKGEIGYSEYKIKPEGFDEAFKRLLENPKAIYPNMKGNIAGYIQGTISRTTGTSGSGTRIPGVILLTDYNNHYDTLKPIITNSATTNRAFDVVQFRTTSNGTISSSNRDNIAYPCVIDSATGEFVDGYIPSSSHHYTITDYYYSTVNVYNADDTIAYPACQGEIETKISDFNEAVEGGAYKVNIKEGEVIANTPLEGAIQGILDVNKAKDVIHQELITNTNKAFTRIYINNNWIEWQEGAGDVDLSDFYTKEETNELISNVEVDLSDYITTEQLEEVINNIDISSEIGLIQDGVNTAFEELPSTFSNYPENPDVSQYPFELKVTHHSYHMVFYFPENPNMKVGVIRRSDGKLGFKLIDSSFNYTQYKGYYRKATSNSGNWSAFSNNNHFINPDTRELTNIYYHNFDLLNANNPSEVMFYGEVGLVEGAISDFNKATEYDKYNVISATGEIANSPIEGSFKGVLNVSNVNSVISQELHTVDNKTYKRVYNGVWTEWEEDVKRSEIEDLLKSAPEKLKSITITNADGMPEKYQWLDMNGLKIMWINVRHSEAEYNSGVNGAMMKTLNFPTEAQVFNTILSATITSYCRESNVTLSRVVQNVEVISNVSVRGRWRHTDDIKPAIDRFTIMCIGF